jgi:hypothetical protein
MDYLGELSNGKIYIPIHVDLNLFESIQEPIMNNKAQFIMDVLHMAQTVGVYQLIPKVFPPFGKVALALHLSQTAFDRGVYYIRSKEQWKSLYTTLERLLSYIPVSESVQTQLFTEWNHSPCIEFENLNITYHTDDISMWMETIRNHVFVSPI